jgi:hypothetical protein
MMYMGSLVTGMMMSLVNSPYSNDMVKIPKNKPVRGTAIKCFDCGRGGTLRKLPCGNYACESCCEKAKGAEE